MNYQNTKAENCQIWIQLRFLSVGFPYQLGRILNSLFRNLWQIKTTLNGKSDLQIPFDILQNSLCVNFVGISEFRKIPHRSFRRSVFELHDVAGNFLNEPKRFKLNSRFKTFRKQQRTYWLFDEPSISSSILQSSSDEFIF